MPTSGYDDGPFWHGNPKRWDACRRKATDEMLAEGWDRLSKKFDAAMRRRARRIYLSGTSRCS